MHEPLVQANVREHISIVPKMHGHVAHDILMPCPGIGLLRSENSRDAQVSLGRVRDDLSHCRQSRLILAPSLAVHIVLGLAGNFLFVKPVWGQYWLVCVAVPGIPGAYDNMSFVRLMNLPMSGIACRKLPMSGYSVFGKMNPV